MGLSTPFRTSELVSAVLAKRSGTMGDGLREKEDQKQKRQHTHTETPSSDGAGEDEELLASLRSQLLLPHVIYAGHTVLPVGYQPSSSPTTAISPSYLPTYILTLSPNVPFWRGIGVIQVEHLCYIPLYQWKLQKEHESDQAKQILGEA